MFTCIALLVEVVAVSLVVIGLKGLEFVVFLASKTLCSHSASVYLLLFKWLIDIPSRGE